MCHGYLVNGEPQVVLEHENGSAHVVHGRLLVQRLKELQRLPRLVVLASCQSAAGDDAGLRDAGAVAALGPQLVEIGVPAVLAMQGNVTMRTVERFIPAFFRGLQRHGRIDQAMTEARAEIRDRADWWAPDTVHAPAQRTAVVRRRLRAPGLRAVVGGQSATSTPATACRCSGPG